jgi:hypothetical protein
MPLTSTLGATSATKNEPMLRHVYRAPRTRVECFLFFQKPVPWVWLAMQAFKVELHFGEQRSFKSRSGTHLFAFQREAQKSSTRNSHAAKPFCSRNQSSCATSVERVAEPKIHGFSFFLGRPHFGHTHANGLPFLQGQS